MNLFPPYIESGLIWVLWCFLHSLLISRSWTGWLQRILGSTFALYRLFYSLFSLATLAAVVFYQFSLEQVVFFSWRGLWLFPQILLYLYGLFMFYVGWKRYDLPFFLGTKQAKFFFSGKPLPPMVFQQNIRGGVRHPWYSGGIALVLVFGSVTDVTLGSKIVLICYFVIGSFLEERKLRIELGEPYKQYCRKVPMLFPWRIKLI